MRARYHVTKLEIRLLKIKSMCFFSDPTKQLLSIFFLLCFSAMQKLHLFARLRNCGFEDIFFPPQKNRRRHQLRMLTTTHNNRHSPVHVYTIACPGMTKKVESNRSWSCHVCVWEVYDISFPEANLQHE